MSLQPFRPAGMCRKAFLFFFVDNFDCIDSVLLAPSGRYGRSFLAISWHFFRWPFIQCSLLEWEKIFLFPLPTCDLLNRGIWDSSEFRYGSNSRTSVVPASFCSIFVSLPASTVNDLGACRACLGFCVELSFGWIYSFS